MLVIGINTFLKIAFKQLKVCRNPGPNKSQTARLMHSVTGHRKPTPEQNQKTGAVANCCSTACLVGRFENNVFKCLVCRILLIYAKSVGYISRKCESQQRCRSICCWRYVSQRFSRVTLFINFIQFTLQYRALPNAPLPLFAVCALAKHTAGLPIHLSFTQSLLGWYQWR